MQMGVFRAGFKAMFERGKWKVLRGDKVVVTAGKDAGQVGTVLRVIRDPRFPRVIVEGLNLVRAGGAGAGQAVGRPTRCTPPCVLAALPAALGAAATHGPAAPTDERRHVVPAWRSRAPALVCRTSGTSSAPRTTRAAS